MTQAAALDDVFIDEAFAQAECLRRALGEVTFATSALSALTLIREALRMATSLVGAARTVDFAPAELLAVTLEEVLERAFNTSRPAFAAADRQRLLEYLGLLELCLSSFRDEKKSPPYRLIRDSVAEARAITPLAFGSQSEVALAA